MNEQENQTQVASNNAEISVPGDMVMKALKRLVAAEDITEDQMADTLWFYNVVKEKGLSLAAAGRAVGFSPASVYRLFTGTYGASYTGLIDKVTKFRKLAEDRANRKDIGFVETATWKKIESACTQALRAQMPAFIYGPSQMGKTTCLLEFQRRNNHGQTKYVRMPACPSFLYFVKTVAASCHIGTNHASSDDLRDRICEAIDNRNLLIIDEFHQALVTVTERRAAQIMEFIREIYDRTGCGLVLSATNVGELEIERGHNAQIYEQLRRRGMTKLILPDLPPEGDIKKIAKAFGLPPPEGLAKELVNTMLKTSGLGMYVKYLQGAHELAKNRGEAISWDAFLAVYDGMNQMTK